MAVTVLGSGTQTATVTTEHTLQDTSAVGTYQLCVDTTAMLSGDALELRAKKIVKTGGTLLVCYYVLYTGAQPTADLLKVSVPISTGLADAAAIRFTLKQTLGTSRTFDWEVLKFA